MADNRDDYEDDEECDYYKSDHWAAEVEYDRRDIDAQDDVRDCD